MRNSRGSICERSVKAMWPTSFMRVRELPVTPWVYVLLSKSLVRHCQLSNEWLFYWNSYALIEQWGCLITNYFVIISSLIGISQGSKVISPFTLGSFTAITVTVVAPNPWPMTVNLDKFSSTWLPRACLVIKVISLRSPSSSFYRMPSLCSIPFKSLKSMFS